MKYDHILQLWNCLVNHMYVHVLPRKLLHIIYSDY